MGKKKGHTDKFENYFREKFEQFEHKPGKNVWRGISRKLFFQDFFRFNMGKFNIYHAGLFVLTGIATYYFADNHVADKVGPTEKQNTIILETAGQKDHFPDTLSLIDTQMQPPDRMNTGSEEKENFTEIITGNKENKSVQKDIEWKQTPKTFQSMQTDVLKTSNQSPVSNFEMSKKEGCVPLYVYFANTSHNAVSYTWDFGDGNISHDKHPGHTYVNPGDYLVQLTVTGANDQTQTHSDTITTFIAPIARFSIDKENIPQEPVYFSNQSRNAGTFHWDFGDGNTSDETNPVHYYASKGIYHVELIAYTHKACIDTFIIYDAFPEEDGVIVFPNAFTPNSNGPSNGYYQSNVPSNHVFHPVAKNVAKYHLRVYNRGGVILFESEDVNIGWDGYLNGKLAEQGVYIWKAYGTYLNGKKFEVAGDVTLLYHKP